jgi:hypothetical protein
MSAVSQDISSILWNLEICYSAHKSPLIDACSEPDKMFPSTSRSSKCYLYIISSVTDFKEDEKNDVT